MPANVNATERDFLNLQKQILSRNNENAKVVDQINRFSKKRADFAEDLLKASSDELSKRNLILENVIAYAEKVKEAANGNEAILKNSQQMVDWAERYQDTIGKAGGFIDDMVDKIPFLGQEFKKSIATTAKNIFAPLIDKFAKFKDGAIASFNKIGIVGKLAFAAIAAAIFAAFKLFKKLDDATVDFMQNIGATRKDVSKLVGTATELALTSAK